MENIIDKNFLRYLLEIIDSELISHAAKIGRIREDFRLDKKNIMEHPKDVEEYARLLDCLLQFRPYLNDYEKQVTTAIDSIKGV